MSSGEGVQSRGDKGVHSHGKEARKTVDKWGRNCRYSSLHFWRKEPGGTQLCGERTGCDDRRENVLDLPSAARYCLN